MLQITKEKVLEAAAKCSTAKETLKVLFPEVFEEEKLVEIGDIRRGAGQYEYYLKGGELLFQVGVGLAPSKELEGKCLVLNHYEFDWEIKEIDEQIILIPRRK